MKEESGKRQKLDEFKLPSRKKLSHNSNFEHLPDSTNDSRYYAVTEILEPCKSDNAQHERDPLANDRIKEKSITWRSPLVSSPAMKFSPKLSFQNVSTSRDDTEVDVQNETTNETFDTFDSSRSATNLNINIQGTPRESKSLHKIRGTKFPLRDRDYGDSPRVSANQDEAKGDAFDICSNSFIEKLGFPDNTPNKLNARRPEKIESSPIMNYYSQLLSQPIQAQKQKIEATSKNDTQDKIDDEENKENEPDDVEDENRTPEINQLQTFPCKPQDCNKQRNRQFILAQNRPKYSSTCTYNLPQNRTVNYSDARSTSSYADRNSNVSTYNDRQTSDLACGKPCKQWRVIPTYPQNASQFRNADYSSVASQMEQLANGCYGPATNLYSRQNRQAEPRNNYWDFYPNPDRLRYPVQNLPSQQQYLNSSRCVDDGLDEILHSPEYFQNVPQVSYRRNDRETLSQYLRHKNNVRRLNNFPSYQNYSQNWYKLYPSSTCPSVPEDPAFDPLSEDVVAHSVTHQQRVDELNEENLHNAANSLYNSSCGRKFTREVLHTPQRGTHHRTNFYPQMYGSRNNSTSDLRPVEYDYHVDKKLFPGGEKRSTDGMASMLNRSLSFDEQGSSRMRRTHPDMTSFTSKYPDNWGLESFNYPRHFGQQRASDVSDRSLTGSDQAQCLEECCFPTVKKFQAFPPNDKEFVMNKFLYSLDDQ